MLEGSDILFMGIGKSAILWYRCALPAIHIGADWVGVYGTPPGLQVVTGLVAGNTSLPQYENYKVIVIQQPHGPAWLRLIHRLRGLGIKVLYEVDDYLHGVPKQKTHDFAKHYSKQLLRDHEMCMRVCDGMICSTDFIARKYARWNKHIYVLHNGLDIGRYNLTRPQRSTVNFGWAGATGHIDALVPWLNELLPVMREHEDTTFVSIGQPGLAQPFNQALGANRAIGIPFTQLESYPAAMCMVDVALAPSGNTAWFWGKSDLRWLEAGALGIPIIADPRVYPEIEHGVNGLHAESPKIAGELARELLVDEDWRLEIGAAAREHVRRERSMEAMAPQWMEVASAVAGGYKSMAQLERAGGGTK